MVTVILQASFIQSFHVSGTRQVLFLHYSVNLHDSSTRKELLCHLGEEGPGSVTDHPPLLSGEAAAQSQAIKCESFLSWARQGHAASVMLSRT